MADKAAAAQTIARQQRSRFIKLNVTSWFASTQYIVIHTRQIVMHQRIGMNKLDRSSSHGNPLDIGLCQFTCSK